MRYTSPATCTNGILRRFALISLMLALAGCAGLKPLNPLDPVRKAAILEECRRPFLHERFRLVHALETAMPGGATGTAIGVLVADPRSRAFRTALMTIEGFILFDAEAGQTLTVHRAVPPFDKTAFAEGLAADIRLAFFPPRGEPAAWGEGEEGAPICRYELPDGRMEEVSTFRNGEVEIRLYGNDLMVQKRVKMAALNEAGLAQTVEIRGGWPPYGLRLRLLEHEALGSSAAVPERPAGADTPGPNHGREKRMP